MSMWNGQKIRDRPRSAYIRTRLKHTTVMAAPNAAGGRAETEIFGGGTEKTYASNDGCTGQARAR